MFDFLSSPFFQTLAVFGVLILLCIGVIVVAWMKPGKTKSLIKRVFAGVMLIIMGVVVIVFAHKEADLLLLSGIGGVRAEGKVIEIETKKMRSSGSRVSDDRVMHCRPVVAYSDKEGAEHRVASTVWSRACTVVVGDVMRLTYDAEDPGRAVLHDVWLRIVAAIVTSIGLFVGGVLAFLGKKNLDAVVRRRRFR